MDTLSTRPAQPERTDNEKRAGDASERQPPHLFVARPRAIEALRAGQVPVPRQVDASGDKGADADREEGETCFTGVEVVDAGEDYGIGLQEYVEYGVFGGGVSREMALCRDSGGGLTYRRS